MSSSPLSVRALTKRFEAGTVNEKLALDHLDLEVPAGQFVTVLGSNGSGKSTLFNAILGRLTPDSGHILLGEEDITRQKDYQRALNIGCLYQNPLRGTAPNMTIEENLALAYTRKASPSFFAVNRKDNAYFRDLLSTLNMGLEDRMKTKMGLLSGGQRQAACRRSSIPKAAESTCNTSRPSLPKTGGPGRDFFLKYLPWHFLHRPLKRFTFP